MCEDGRRQHAATAPVFPPVRPSDGYLAIRLGGKPLPHMCFPGACVIPLLSTSLPILLTTGSRLQQLRVSPSV